MALSQDETQAAPIAREITVHTIGHGGIDELSSHMDDAALSWALLRHETEKGTSGQEMMVAVACQGADMPGEDHRDVVNFSSEVLQLLGKVDATLRVTRGKELPRALDEVLARRLTCGPQVAEEALSSLANASSPHNWVLLEPQGLQLHKAGCGGLDELKQWLPADKVMFGALRFLFPRSDGVPPIVKYLFIHWIGPKTSVVRRGQWNSKAEAAAQKMRSHFDFAFRKTAYALEDFNLASLIEELGRVTCITSSDSRQFSVDWYLEGVQTAEGAMSLETSQCGPAECNEPSTTHLKPFLRKSAEDALQVVREPAREWKWVLLTIHACGASSFQGFPHSGGA